MSLRMLRKYYGRASSIRELISQKTILDVSLTDLGFCCWAGEMISCFRNRKDRMEFMRNGRMLLEESITLFNGNINPVHCFSVQELSKATNYFDEAQLFLESGDFKLYKSFLQGRPVIVKTYGDVYSRESHIREIVVASRMSVHKNVLRLLGCCLETEIPILVFESAECEGTLHNRIHDPRVAKFQYLTWKDRLKIAVDVSNMVAYLHTAFPRPIVHRDLQPSNMLLDKDQVVKIFDFSLSIPIPEGETHIEEDPMGTAGFLAPECFSRGRFNEKADVYGFGVFLLVLLSGKKAYDHSLSTIGEANLVVHVTRCIENERFNEILDTTVSEDQGAWPGKQMQLKEFAMLALQCTSYRQANRPDITDVEKKLREMYQSLISWRELNLIIPHCTLVSLLPSVAFTSLL